MQANARVHRRRYSWTILYVYLYAARFSKKKLLILAIITTQLLCMSTINVDEHAWSLRSRRKLLRRKSKQILQLDFGLSTCRHLRRAGRPPRQPSGSSSFFRSFTPRQCTKPHPRYPDSARLQQKEAVLNHFSVITRINLRVSQILPWLQQPTTESSQEASGIRRVIVEDTQVNGWVIR